MGMKEEEKSIGKRILVIGSPGSGKSTFAGKLSRKTGLPLFYLDMLYHTPEKTTVPREVFDAALEEILKKDRWIIDGNYMRTLPRRLSFCDTVFFFDLPCEECIEGAKERIGKPRADMPWIEEEFDPEFRQYILDFPNDQTPKIYDLLNRNKDGKNLGVFHRREEANAFLNERNTAV